MRKVAIIQARMTSTRLPGKVLAPILGRPMLALQIERMLRSKATDEIVIATTSNATDDPVAALADRLGLRVVRGSEHDVLSRFALAVNASRADLVLRITADCPFMLPQLMDEAWDALGTGEAVDFVSNMLELTYPYGLAVEATRAKHLLSAHSLSTDAFEREHVTPYIWRRPQAFRIQSLRLEADHSFERWTVDTPQDLELVKKVFEGLYPLRPEFGMHDVIEFLNKQPELRLLNQGVQQNAVPAFSQARVNP
jgi:spore coat polysaccharide biosynthesis protein SpsF